MLFEVPVVATDAPEVSLTETVSPAETVSLEEATVLVATRHRAAVTLIARNPTPFPCDPADVTRWSDACAAVGALPESLRDSAIAAFRDAHFCRVLATCPMADRRRGR